VWQLNYNIFLKFFKNFEVIGACLRSFFNDSHTITPPHFPPPEIKIIIIKSYFFIRKKLNFLFIHRPQQSWGELEISTTEAPDLLGLLSCGRTDQKKFIE